MYVTGFFGCEYKDAEHMWIFVSTFGIKGVESTNMPVSI